MTRKILCVDDEENVLRALERTLRSHFEIETAVGGMRGLAALAERGPYAVVVSDLRMPEMDGVQFLSEVRKRSPESVRLILSGYADLEAAIASFNQSQVFQFLTKPCPTDRLRDTLNSALAQYQLITAERELLEETLRGSLAVMTEILGMVNPFAFSRASRIRRYVRHIANEMRLTNWWEFDVAAMLSQIGCIVVPPDILEKVNGRHALTEEEQKTFSSHPSIAYSLLAKIPRLEAITEMVLRQMEPVRELRNPKVSDVVAIGAQMLLIATSFDETVCSGASPSTAIRIMRARPEIYQASVVAAMETADVSPVELQVKKVYLRDIQPGMVVNVDIRAKTGLFLVPKGQVMSEALIARLINFGRTVGFDEPLSMLVSVEPGMASEPIPKAPAVATP